MGRRKNARRRKYRLALQTKPADLEGFELAVLIGMTSRLSNYANIPGFDPTTAQLQITFASGRKGVAKLEAEPPEGSQGGG